MYAYRVGNRAGRPAAIVFAALGILCGVALCGCARGTPPVTLTPAERLTLQGRALDLLLRAAESDTDFVAANAIEALVLVAPREGVPVFRKAIQSPSPLVRYAGYVALGEVRDTQSTPAIVEGVKDAHRLVRMAAAFAAYRCGREGAARILARTLTDSPDEALRADAATLIGRLREQRARRWLEAALLVPVNERSTRVSLQVHFALAKLGVEPSVQELIVYSQGNAAIRPEALLLLAPLRNPAPYDALQYRLFSPDEDYVEARLIAARGLGGLGSADGFEYALQMLAYVDPNPRPSAEKPDQTFAVRSLAAHALAEIADVRAVPGLRAVAATSDDRRLQVAASYALCKILHR